MYTFRTVSITGNKYIGYDVPDTGSSSGIIERKNRTE